MNELEALNLAIEREKEAHLLYSEATARTTDGKGIAEGGAGCHQPLQGADKKGVK